MSHWFGKFFGRAPTKLPQQAAPTPEVKLRPATSTVSFFRLQSTQGDFLVLPPEAGQLARAKNLDPACAVVAIVPDAHTHLCLIVAPDARPFAIEGDTMRGVGISARILPTTQRGIVRLKQPLGAARFLTAAEDGEMHFSGAGTDLAAAFALVPLTPSAVGSPVAGLGTRFGAMVAEGLHEAAMVAHLRAHTLPAEMAEAILRLLPRDELSDLARRFLDEPPLLALLRALLPGNDFMHKRIPELARWRASRSRMADGQGDSSASDEATVLPSVNMAALPFGHALLTLARGHVAPRRSFCLLASARNEGPYLLDWLSYHLSIGFEHVFLYTNDNDDGSDTLLALLARHGVVTLMRNERGPAIGVQEKAYAHALTLLPQILDYRWTAVLDLDEYFVFDANMFNGVADFVALHEAQPVDAIAMCWLLFAARFGDAYREAPVTERFLWRAADVNSHVKSMFRTRMFWHSQPHFPYPTMEGAFTFRTPDGGFHHHPGVADRLPAFAARPAAEQAWINHYFLRTPTEALWKLARGSAAWLQGEDESGRLQFGEFIAKTFVDLAKPETQMEDRRIQACARGQPAMLEALLSLPGIAGAQGKILHDFNSRLKRMSSDFLARFPAGASPALQRFRDAVAGSQGICQPAPVILRSGARMI